MSRIIVDSIRNSSAGSDGITLSSDGKVAFPNTSTGKILQVVQTFKTDKTSQTGTGSSNFFDISGMSVAITPSSSSNKILITWVCSVGCSLNGRNNFIRLLRGSTVIGNSTAGSSENGQAEDRTSTDVCRPYNMMFLDSPATTSSTTYKMQWACENGVYHLNTDHHEGQGAVSHITAMEIAA